MNNPTLIKTVDVITEEITQALVDIFDKKTIDEVTHTDTGTHSVIIGESNAILKYEEDNGRVVMSCKMEDTTGLFEKVVNWVIDSMPETQHFEKVEEWKIISYPTGTLQNFAKDNEDSEVTGIVICALNGDYGGGNLIVDNDIIAMVEGDIVAFNQPHERFYAITPVNTNERLILELWFSPFEDEQQEEIQPTGKVYSKVVLKT